MLSSKNLMRALFIDLRYNFMIVFRFKTLLFFSSEGPACVIRCPLVKT